ncbi:MAG: hypothetical protein C5B43_03315 [Verrucomicrobia bacterium]|nr:MAG: hypothetical protein C5B43_03315 [Verrucomicrobiota bacterium]
MKKLPIFFLLFSLIPNLPVSADTFITGKKAKKILLKGPARLSDVKADSVIIDGYLAFNNLEVTGDVTVSHPIREESQNLKCRHLTLGKSITANNVQCESAYICGSACLENIEVSGNTTITSNAKIKNGKMSNLNLTSNEIHLNNVNLKDIIIEETRNSTNQVLYLKGKSIADNISFKSGNGVIFMDKESKVNGEINGAIVNRE